MKKLLFCIVYFLPVLIYAQTNQVKRTELELNGQKGDYKMIPVKNNGLILFTESEESTKEISTWMFSLYDTDFAEKWTKNVQVNGRLNFNDYCLDNQHLYLLFTNYKLQEYSVITIDVSSGDIKEINGKYLKKYSIKSFKAKDNQIYLDGTYKNKPALGYIDLASSSFRFIPVTFGGNTSIESISFAKDSDIASVIFLTWVKRESHLSVYTFRKGERQTVMDVKAEEEKNIMTARLNVLTNGEKLIIGTYSEGGMRSNGMYICKFTEEGQQYIKFYNFKDLKNFLSYLPERSQERIKEKIIRKEAKGKEINFNYNLLVHDIIEKNEEYILIAEAYYATYRTEYYTTTVAGPNGTMRTVTRTRQVFDGWLFTHALIGGFNSVGDLIWDNTFEMGDFKTFVLKERITVNNNSQNILLTYGYGRYLRTKIIEGNNVVEKKQLVEIETMSEADKVRTSTSSVEFWYDNYFIAYGYQKIKNKELEKTKRYIFYLTKVAYQNQ